MVLPFLGFGYGRMPAMECEISSMLTPLLQALRADVVLLLAYSPVVRLPPVFI